MFRVLGIASIALYLFCMPIAQGGSLGPFNLTNVPYYHRETSYNAPMMLPSQYQSFPYKA